MNLPNLITLGRLVLTAGCFACLGVIDDPQGAHLALVWAAFGAFVLAAVSDFIDGFLARRLDQVTTFGRVMDPFADKVLICGALIMLLRFPAVLARMPAWFVVVVVARELLVTAIRGLAESRGVAFPAERLGKLKMVAQCVLVGGLLILLGDGADWTALAAVVDVALWLTLVLTLTSCAQYMYRARHLLSE